MGTPQKRLVEAGLTCSHNLCFGAKIRKIGTPLHTPVLYIKVGYEGVYFSWTFPDEVFFTKVLTVRGYQSSQYWELTYVEFQQELSMQKKKRCTSFYCMCKRYKNSQIDQTSQFPQGLTCFTLFQLGQQSPSIFMAYTITSMSGINQMSTSLRGSQRKMLPTWIPTSLCLSLLAQGDFSIAIYSRAVLIWT